MKARALLGTSSCAMRTLMKTLSDFFFFLSSESYPCSSSSLIPFPREDNQRCSGQISCICDRFSSCSRLRKLLISSSHTLKTFQSGFSLENFWNFLTSIASSLTQFFSITKLLSDSSSSDEEIAFAFRARDLP